MINIGEVLLDLWNSSGFAAMSAGFADGGWQNLVCCTWASSSSSSPC